jgi:hypothetical protein
MFDEYAVGMPSYRKVLADEVITHDELGAQARVVEGLLRRLESELDERAHETATEFLCELAVLHALEHANRREQQ